MLVNVISAAINPVDYKVPESGWFGKTFGMAKDSTPGLDFSGRIVAKHTSVTTFSEGQLVFGSLHMVSTYGTLGQVIIVSTSECALLPRTVDPDIAAAIGTAAGTAWKSLPTELVKPDAQIFINGGSGGVGTYAIQFAKILGAKVVTSCSTPNVELCHRIGADEVLDYKTTNIVAELSQRGQVFDVVIDNAGNPPHIFEQCHEFLKPSGRYMQIAANPFFRDMCTSLSKTIQSKLPGHDRRNYHFVMEKCSSEDYTRFVQWVVEGKLNPIIDSVFKFEDVPAAFTKLRTGRGKGKIIVQVMEKHGEL